MHNVCMYLSYATCNTEIDNARHAKLRNVKTTTPNVKQERNGNW